MKTYELSSRTRTAIRTLVDGRNFLIPEKGTTKIVQFSELPQSIVDLLNVKEIIVKEIITDKEYN